MFVKYRSLENSYRQAFVNQCDTLGVRDWVALEKIHGANFGFIVSVSDTINVDAFKRTSTIGANKAGEYDFYGCTSVVEAHKSKMKLINDWLWGHLVMEEGETVIVYGELAGQGVQKEVKYGEKDFYAFDIYLPKSDRYLDWDDVKAACEFAGVKTTNEIARGELAELLAIDPLFRSTHTPEDVEGDNWAEGFVVKQLQKESLLPNGKRAILKVKNDRFKEKKKKAGKVPKPAVVYTDEQLKLHSEFSLYITENRLKNVVSKIGTLTNKQFGMLSGAFIKDAKDEFERDERNEVAIERDDWNVIKRSLTDIANQVIKKHWLDILDSEF